MIDAKVIADSITDHHDRLTTVEATMHRFVLAEFNTHRKFSRNSASSRAIPVKKQIDWILNNDARPLKWPAEQSGMQGGEEISPAWPAELAWTDARDACLAAAERLVEIGVHKSVTNRLLEPFMWHTVIVSSTEWDNFFAQRDSPLAQPEIQAVAEKMRLAIEASEPQKLERDEWHMPYISAEDLEWAEKYKAEATEMLTRVSVARCARVSYLTHDGRRDQSADLTLYERLVTAEPPHWSPLEHVATPDPNCVLGNFTGWAQKRHW